MRKWMWIPLTRFYFHLTDYCSLEGLAAFSILQHIVSYTDPRTIPDIPITLHYCIWYLSSDYEILFPKDPFDGRFNSYCKL